MKKIILFLFSSISLVTLAQQQGHYSMYMVNQYLLNPAVAGTEDYVDIKAGFRSQWVGLADRPQSYVLTAHGPVKKNIEHKNFEDVKPMPWHSVGGMVTGEVTGPINKNSIFGTYAYHIPLSKTLNLSLGASVGVQQWRVNAAELKYDAQNSVDKATSTNTTVWSPDGNVGVWLYNKKFYVGASSMQVFNQKIDIASGTNGADVSKLNRHFFATAGYRIKLDSAGKWALVPSFMFKAIAPTPAQIDLNCKIRYKDTFWGGLSWRNQDAVVFIVGMTIKERVDIGYSYDATTSKLANYSNGSHEVVVGLRVPHLRHKPAPAQFW
ncbi:MAG: type IX secretion system membrane protein PorP/SprF [Cytophagales bacterium]